MEIRVNPDKEVAELVRKKVRENDGYCPCKLLKTPETKCLCQDFLNSTEPGLCHCGLYEKVEV